MSRIVQAQIGPIRADKIRLKPVTKEEPKTDGKVDPEHPITKAMLERLPKMSFSDLEILLTHLKNKEAYATGSMSKAEDVDSWIWMVEEELKFRERESRGLLASLLSKFQIEVKS